MSSELIIHASDASFEQDVLKSDVPVLLDFWAPWCGPCKMIAPILDDIASEFQGRLKVVKINIDDNEATPAKFGVRGIPTLMVFKNGENVATKVGALAKGQLTAFVEASIAYGFKHTKRPSENNFQTAFLYSLSSQWFQNQAGIFCFHFKQQINIRMFARIGFGIGNMFGKPC